MQNSIMDKGGPRELKIYIHAASKIKQKVQKHPVLLLFIMS